MPQPMARRIMYASRSPVHAATCKGKVHVVQRLLCCRYALDWAVYARHALQLELTCVSSHACNPGCCCLRQRARGQHVITGMLALPCLATAVTTFAWQLEVRMTQANALSASPNRCASQSPLPPTPSTAALPCCAPHWGSGRSAWQPITSLCSQLSCCGHRPAAASRKCRPGLQSAPWQRLRRQQG
jgi:hypothetical protein